VICQGKKRGSTRGGITKESGFYSKKADEGKISGADIKRDVKMTDDWGDALGCN